MLRSYYKTSNYYRKKSEFSFLIKAIINPVEHLLNVYRFNERIKKQTYIQHSYDLNILLFPGVG